MRPMLIVFFFFFNDTATTEIYTLSLHDALPILAPRGSRQIQSRLDQERPQTRPGRSGRSEEHTSELQSQSNLVCRLLLEKKNRARHRSPSRSSPPSRRTCTPCRRRCQAQERPWVLFFNDPATTEIYTLSLHDALPISPR